MPSIKKFFVTAVVLGNLAFPSFILSQANADSPDPKPAVRFVGAVEVPQQHRFIALLEDRTNGAQESLEPGDELSNRYRVVSVDSKSVVIFDKQISKHFSLNISGAQFVSSKEFAGEKNRRDNVSSTAVATGAAAGVSTDGSSEPRRDAVFHSDANEIVDAAHWKNGKSLYGEAARQFEIRGETGIEGMAIYNLPSDSLFSQAGLQDGDIIRMVNSRPITKLTDYFRATRKNTGIEIFFERAGQMRRMRIVPG